MDLAFRPISEMRAGFSSSICRPFNDLIVLNYKTKMMEVPPLWMMMGGVLAKSYSHAFT
jgi:hypothetical protein